MHIEYAIPLIHNRLVRDGLRNHISFFVSGGIRTYEDVIKAIALGADGIIWGTAPLVAIGCDRNRNCHDGCSRGIATSNLTMQKLRDIELNTRQIVNTFVILQMQVIRALAALGLKDIRELRGRHDKIHWIGLKERVDHRARINREIDKEVERQEQTLESVSEPRPVGESNCGVAAVNGTHPIPSYILDRTLAAMKNRGMDGVGVAKSLCFPEHPNDYAFRVMIKGVHQTEVEAALARKTEAARQNMTVKELRNAAREVVIDQRIRIMEQVKKIFLDPYFEYVDFKNIADTRESYKKNNHGGECDYREFGNDQTDPGDIFTFFVQVKPKVLQNYIEHTLLPAKDHDANGRPSQNGHFSKHRFLQYLFPGISLQNYEGFKQFMQKAEDLFIYYFSRDLTRILYASEAKPDYLKKFAARVSWLKSGEHNGATLSAITDDVLGNLESYVRLMHDFIRTYPFNNHRYLYTNREHKIAAVMSCGKNFATWKTAGREIPWETPAAPNNIIHVRLATGSVVEQMNSHPFSSLHTALTHNGETTNYEALKQRAEFFGLSPVATTDTEVAALKFHLIADEWEYPDWAMFESFSPTTGDDLLLVDPEKRKQLDEVQRVEFASSPDGPYQYLCLRHNPNQQTTERVDLKDPADLRPNVSAFWIDKKNGSSRAFSIIASEEQAVNTMLSLLDKEGLIDGSVADSTLVSSGMISRYHFDEGQKIDSFEFIDRYGEPIALEGFGEHYSYLRQPLKTPPPGLVEWLDVKKLITESAKVFAVHLKELDFNSYRWILQQCVDKATSLGLFGEALDLLTWLNNYMRTLDTGNKAKSSMLDITRHAIDELIDQTAVANIFGYRQVNQKQAWQFTGAPESIEECLVIDCTGFLPEGTDPDYSLAAFLRRAYNVGWRRYLLYRVSGQRLISTAVMGDHDTDEVEMDVYGTPGEYCGAFMQGGIIRVHGNAQNFCGMCMHHGELYVFGNAGKVCGYASKGGKVFIMGNVVDRAWTNSVNDSRCQDLEIMILGSASKFAGESLMGGEFYFAGLHFDAAGKLRANDRPYLGTKLLGGASRGKFFFFDPQNRLNDFQYTHGKLEEMTEAEWQTALTRFKEVLQLSNVKIEQHDEKEFVQVDEQLIELTPSNFKLIVPKGGLKGYESH